MVFIDGNGYIDHLPTLNLSWTHAAMLGLPITYTIILIYYMLLKQKVKRDWHATVANSNPNANTNSNSNPNANVYLLISWLSIFVTTLPLPRALFDRTTHIAGSGTIAYIHNWLIPSRVFAGLIHGYGPLYDLLHFHHKNDAFSQASSKREDASINGSGMDMIKKWCRAIRNFHTFFACCLLPINVHFEDTKIRQMNHVQNLVYKNNPLDSKDAIHTYNPTPTVTDIKTTTTITTIATTTRKTAPWFAVQALMKLSLSAIMILMAVPYFSSLDTKINHDSPFINTVKTIASSLGLNLSYALIVYSTAAFLFETCSIIAVMLFDLPCHASFNMPWMSTSLQEFWSRRWNVMTKISLHDGIYFPFLHSSYIRTHVFRGNIKLHQAVSILLSFTISGIFHEWIIYNMTGYLSLEWLLFFPLHGLLCLIEHHIINLPWIRPVYQDKIPVVLKWVVTMAILISTAPLFYRPLLRGSYKDRCFENLTQWLRWLDAIPSRSGSHSDFGSGFGSDSMDL